MNTLKNKLIQHSPLAIPIPFHMSGDCERSHQPPVVPQHQHLDTIISVEKEETVDARSKGITIEHNENHKLDESIEQFNQDFRPLKETVTSPTPREKKLMGFITKQKTQLKKKTYLVYSIKKKVW